MGEQASLAEPGDRGEAVTFEREHHQSVRAGDRRLSVRDVAAECGLTVGSRGNEHLPARAAARQMLEQRSGVIIFLTAVPARAPLPGSSGIGAAYGAVENVMRTMAIELGPAGVRVVCLRTTANPDTRSIQDTTEVRAKMMNITPEEAMARLADGTMLKVLPQAADTAKAAAFLASDRARMMTGTVLNASAGAVTD